MHKIAEYAVVSVQTPLWKGGHILVLYGFPFKCTDLFRLARLWFLVGWFDFVVIEMCVIHRPFTQRRFYIC